MASYPPSQTTCEPAGFGRNKENIYDESYRKAGKLSSDFALHSDVEHEVAVVTSEHRITITYNLYFDHQNSRNLPKPLSSMLAMNNFKDELSSLLIDPEFLPDGGYLAFGLEYAYSLPNCWSKLSDLENRLKGVDADLVQVFKELSLVTSFWSVIDHGGNLFACENRVPDTEWEEFGENKDFTEWMVKDEGALVLKSDDGYTKVNIYVNWVKKLVKAQWGKQSFINYGFTDHAYHNVCLIVKVGKPGRRGIPESPAPISDEGDFGDEVGRGRTWQRSRRG